MPWQQQKVYTVMDQLDTEAAAYTAEAQRLLAAGQPMAALKATTKALMLDRDATAAAYEWEGLQRGKESGALARPDFADQHGQEILSRLPVLLQLAPEKVQVSIEQGGGGVRLQELVIASPSLQRPYAALPFS